MLIPGRARGRRVLGSVGLVYEALILKVQQSASLYSVPPKQTSWARPQVP